MFPNHKIENRATIGMAICPNLTVTIYFHHSFLSFPLFSRCRFVVRRRRRNKPSLRLGCAIAIVLYEFLGLLCLQVSMRSDLEIVSLLLGFANWECDGCAKEKTSWCAKSSCEDEACNGVAICVDVFLL